MPLDDTGRLPATVVVDVVVVVVVVVVVAATAAAVVDDDDDPLSWGALPLPFNLRSVRYLKRKKFEFGGGRIMGWVGLLGPPLVESFLEAWHGWLAELCAEAVYVCFCDCVVSICELINFCAGV